MRGVIITDQDLTDASPAPFAPPRSYCGECDALPGDCDHTGPRYLDPITYRRVSGPAPGARPMWAIPAEERWRVDNPPRTWSRLDPHALDYGDATPETFGPVETEAGEEMRQLALQILVPKMQRLIDLAKRHPLKLYEREELQSLIETVDCLQGMAPTGPLQKGHAATIE